MGSPRVSSAVVVSDREREVLAAVSEHLTNAEIAERLFISVRTVESHVSSLLRKLEVPHRRELASRAVDHLASASGGRASGSSTMSLPRPLTSFVGRVSESADLARALGEHRLVTAVGPGGVGKTRLALRVAPLVEDRFPGGTWFVDLVAVTGPAMLAAHLATVLGVRESQGRSVEDVVADWLGPRRALLVLDNCEHVLEGVGVLVERLLTLCPGLTVLATSRARLLLPFEGVFPVPGLSLAASAGGLGDAVELFLSRATAGGGAVHRHDLPRVQALCRGLDGMALAIELAAARLPSVGLDGLEKGLADRLVLLTGGSRVDDRHRSLRSTLDWSYELLDDPDRAVLRRVSVFAGPFSARAGTELLAGWQPVEPDTVPAALARLADHSLLVMIAGTTGTRYRPLETIRQYGEALAADVGEGEELRARHLSWCLETAAGLDPPPPDGPRSDGWRAAVDELAVEVRPALAWARPRPDRRPTASRLARLVAELSFLRGRLGESQHDYELAAELADDITGTAEALREAAGAATARQFGHDALRLRREAADAWLWAGERHHAGRQLAAAAELISRGPGLLVELPPDGEAERLLAEAGPLAQGDPATESRILIARAFDLLERDPTVPALVDRAIDLARTAGDRLAESAALDALTGIQLAAGDVRAALTSARRRTELLALVPITPDAALELFDAHGMASQCAVSAGELDEAVRHAGALRDLPFYHDEDHLATSRLIVVTLFTGDWEQTIRLSELFRTAWERAGRPRAGNLSRAPYAAATVHALRGDDGARAGWLEVVAMLGTPGKPLSLLHFGEFFDSLVLLHRGDAPRAVELLATAPEEFTDDYSGIWLPWYASAWVEAAVLAGHPGAVDRLVRAQTATTGNPVARALVRRAAGLAAGDVQGRDDVLAATEALERLGARYQWARSLVMLGGADRERGEQVLAALGATAMPWPP